jgi:hypothetical protein
VSEVREGGCQCGAIRYRVEGEAVGVGVCHCTQCQKQSGSAFGMSFIVRKEAFRITKGHVKTFTRASDSGRPVVCGFCAECGTRIYHETRWLEGVVNVKPGTFDDTSFLQPTTQVWTAKRQGWLERLAELRSFEGQPEARGVATSPAV